jgi:hypothetical protein
MHRKIGPTAIALTLVCLSAAAVAEPPSGSASTTGRCSALAGIPGAQLGEASAKIVSATFNAPSQAQPAPSGAPPWISGLPALPEHCEVMGQMREHTGADGQRYAVRFHLRLPTHWNGRFLFQGGGGTNGQVGDATGVTQPGMRVAVDRGYAVVSTDTGHDNTLNMDPARQGNVVFGHDYEARLEYAEKALDSVATAGKAIVAAYYGRKPRYSYFAGCSNGGREGMVFAQRFPAQFDGILAEAPAFAVPKAALAEAYDAQVFGNLARQMHLGSAQAPDLSRVLTDQDLALAAEAIRESCDSLDGLADGMVQDFRHCTRARVQPALQARTCAAGKTDRCLSTQQVAALTLSLSGPHNSRGQSLYADWPWDPGIAALPWRVWKLGIPGQMPAINILLGSPALSGLFLTPPRDIPATPEAGLAFQLGFDFDRDAAQIYATAAGFPRSSWDLIGAQATDLRAFSAHGGKLIVPHGAADPVFSINDTIRFRCAGSPGGMGRGRPGAPGDRGQSRPGFAVSRADASALPLSGHGALPGRQCRGSRQLCLRGSGPVALPRPGEPGLRLIRRGDRPRGAENSRWRGR